MKKIFSKPIIFVLLILIVVGIFAIHQNARAQFVDPTTAVVLARAAKAALSPANIFDNLFGKLIYYVLQLIALVTGIAAALLNGVVYYTVVKVSENYDKLGPIKEAWKVLRDIANMTFIFTLLYAGIMTILGKGDKSNRIIVNVVVVAALMNFSLFFTRIVIDISNVFAVTFYDAIAPNSLNAAGTFDWSQAGLATAFTNALHLQALYNQSSTMTSGSLIMISVMGSIMLLIATFVFAAMAIMFLIRYVILILVMILSPVFFISFALPEGAGISKYKKMWSEALFGQAFFAPIYFLMTWISLKVLSGVMKAFTEGGGKIDASALGKLTLGQIGQQNIEGAFLMFMNFSIVIILLIASLLISKSWADKAGSGVGKLTSWAGGLAGGATIGLAGGLGRSTVGRFGQAVGESEALKKAMRWSNERGGLLGATTGAATRLSMATAKKVGSSSLDLRATGAGGQLGAGKVGKIAEGGFAEYRKKKVEEEEKFAKSLGPSDKAIGQATEELKSAKDTEKIVRENAERYVDENFRKPETLENLERDITTAEAMARNSTISEQGRAQAATRASELRTRAVPIRTDYDRRRAERIEQEYDKAEIRGKANIAQEKVDALKGVDDDRAKAMLRSTPGWSEERMNSPEGKAEIARLKKENKGMAEVRKQKFADSVEKSFVAKWARGYNYAAAAQIRKGKSKEKQLAEAYKKIVDEEPGETSPPETPPATPPAPPSPPTP